MTQEGWFSVLKADWLILKLDQRSRFFARNTYLDKEASAMKVKLKCFAKLSESDVCDFTGSNEQEISAGETVGSLISRLGFSQEEVKVIFFER